MVTLTMCMVYFSMILEKSSHPHYRIYKIIRQNINIFHRNILGCALLLPVWLVDISYYIIWVVSPLSNVIIVRYMVILLNRFVVWY